jgi:hypothetical protein
MNAATSRIRRGALRASAGLAAAMLLASPGIAATAVSAGAFRVEPPTLVSLGFEWTISGDDNRNASVAVSYRKKGEAAWRTGLPLLRMNGESVRGGKPRWGDDHFYEYTAPNKFAGSVLNLDPDTDYECRFVLTDADGASGTTEQIVTVRTRAVPTPAAGGQVYHVYPYGYKGQRIEPAFTGLMAAYFRGSDQSDHSMTMPPRVQPGDTIMVHAGVYKDRRLSYGGFDPEFGGYGTPFDGTYFLTQSGTADKPIVIKAAGDGEVVFDGDGNHNLFNLLAANYNYFEGITVRNTNIAFLLGLKNITGASGFTLVHSKVIGVGRAVQDEWAGSKNFYIADNVFIGRHNPDKLVGWWPVDVWKDVPGFPAKLDSEYAVKVYGQGHVVAYNYVSGWHDGIDVSTYGTPSEDPDRMPVSIDFYGNDISNIDDNCIETDGSEHNVRVFENRCLNSGAGSFSAQPIFGGPAYFYRNIVYNGSAGGPIKFVDTPSGVLFYNNTFVGQGRLFGPASNVHFRNNLFVGDGWNDALFNFSTFTNYSSSDYNGFRPNPGVKTSFEWTSPAFGTPADYKTPLVQRRFATLKDYAKATGQDTHSVLVDYTIFEKVTPPDRTTPQRLYRPAELDLRLKRGSAATDKGVALPNITDGFTGKAPDLGAYETGRPVPHYGPRTWPLGSSADRPGGGE